MPAPRLVRSVPDALPDRSDDELMTLAQAGVREAFAALVVRHGARLVETCSKFVNDSAAGAELAQETWVGIWTQRAHYRAEGRFVVWLITAARNRCRNHLRRGKLAPIAPSASTAAAGAAVRAPSPLQIDALLLEERRRRVREALARLPERMREALLLRYAEELPYDEMAEVLGTGESTLRSRVHHGLRTLRDLLEKKR